MNTLVHILHYHCPKALASTKSKLDAEIEKIAFKTWKSSS